MAATDDDVIASWHNRVGTLRKRGRIGSAALTIVPFERRGRRLARPHAGTGKAVRRGTGAVGAAELQPPAGWFSGAESLLGSFVTTTLHCRQLEAVLREAKPDMRLTPHSKLPLIGGCEPY